LIEGFLIVFMGNFLLVVGLKKKGEGVGAFRQEDGRLIFTFNSITPLTTPHNIYPTFINIHPRNPSTYSYDVLLH